MENEIFIMEVLGPGPGMQLLKRKEELEKNVTQECQEVSWWR